MAVGPDTPITQLAGVGEARAKKLAKLGLAQAADLLTYYPRDYEDRRKIYALREAPVGQRVCVAALAAEHRAGDTYIRILGTRGRPASARGWSWSS